MATAIAQPGPQCVYSHYWVCFFVKTRYPFRPETIQERINDLDTIAGLPAVEQIRVGPDPVYKVTMPLQSYKDFLTDVDTILSRIVTMEERTATLFTDSEPAGWLQTEEA